MNRLEELIISKGKKKTQVARACGVSYNAVYRWCNGSRRPKPKYIKMLAKVLNVRTSELYELIYGDEQC